MFKSKFFWLNLIAILALVVQYFINNQLLPQYAVYEGLVIVVLNAIAGMLQAKQVTALKAKVTALKQYAK